MVLGIVMRAVAYPLVVIAAIVGFGVAVALGARFAPNVFGLVFGALAIFFVILFVCVKFIERRSAASDKTAFIVATLLTGVMSAGVILVATPIETPREAEAPATFWTLADGARIAYRQCGATVAGQTPVLFLHGGPAIPPRRSSTDTVCALGDAGFSVYLYDQIGSGRSSRIDEISEYTLARHVDDLEAIRRQIGAEQFDVIGVSWGAVLASHYIAAYPGRVRRVVYVSPGILGSRNDVEYDYSASASSDYDNVVLPPARIVVAGLLARANPRLAQEFMPQDEAAAVFDGMVLDPSLSYQGKCKGATIDTSGERGAGANYYANLIAAQSLRRASDPTEAIAATAPPALLLRGVCDYIPRSALQRYQAAYPSNAIVDVESEGHSFLGARPDLIVPAATCWFAEADVSVCRLPQGE